jgi:DNA-binding IclR family transcriptional regulator
MAFDGWRMIGKSGVGERAMKVLCIMLAEMNNGNEITVSQAALAAEAAIHRPDVSLSITKLVDAGILRRGDKQGTYILNPHIGFVGDPDAHTEAILQWDSAKQRDRAGNLQPA